jgi:hypothetical protein
MRSAENTHHLETFQISSTSPVHLAIWRWIKDSLFPQTDSTPNRYPTSHEKGAYADGGDTPDTHLHNSHGHHHRDERSEAVIENLDRLSIGEQEDAINAAEIATGTDLDNDGDVGGDNGDSE